MKLDPQKLAFYWRLQYPIRSPVSLVFALNVPVSYVLPLTLLRVSSFVCHHDTLSRAYPFVGRIPNLVYGSVESTIATFSKPLCVRMELALEILTARMRKLLRTRRQGKLDSCGREYCSSLQSLI